MQFYSGLCVPRWYVGDRTGLRIGARVGVISTLLEYVSLGLCVFMVIIR